MIKISTKIDETSSNTYVSTTVTIVMLSLSSSMNKYLFSNIQNYKTVLKRSNVFNSKYAEYVMFLTEITNVSEAYSEF